MHNIEPIHRMDWLRIERRKVRTMLRTWLASAALAASLFAPAAFGTAAQEATPTSEESSSEETTSQDQTVPSEEAEALIAAVAQATETMDIEDDKVDIVTVEVDRSINLRALRNVVNDSPLLNANNIVINAVVRVTDFRAVVAIAILEGGDLIVFKRG